MCVFSLLAASGKPLVWLTDQKSGHSGYRQLVHSPLPDHPGLHRCTHRVFKGRLSGFGVHFILTNLDNKHKIFSNSHMKVVLDSMEFIQLARDAFHFSLLTNCTVTDCLCSLCSSTGCTLTHCFPKAILGLTGKSDPSRGGFTPASDQ